MTDPLNLIKVPGHLTALSAKPNLLFVLGNGLSIDYTHHLGIESTWHPSRPFDWPVTFPGDTTDMIEAFPFARQLLSDARQQSRDSSEDQFEVIRRAITLAAGGSQAPLSHFSRGKLELDHYIVQLFAAYQEAVDAEGHQKSQSWKWARFLGKHISRIQGIVSFNYDLNIETALESQGALLAHPGTADRRGVIPIVKPHGSIDLFVPPPFRNTPVASYPIHATTNLWMHDNFFEGRVEVIPFHQRQYLRRPRYEVDVVLPTQPSLMHMQTFVAPGLEIVLRNAATADCVIFAGLSYWDVDQPEIDKIIESVNRRAVAIVSNPNPSDALLSRLSVRFTKDNVHLWRTGPEKVIFG